MKRHMLSLLRDVRNRHVLGFDLIMFCCIPALALLLRVDSLEQMGKYVVPLGVYTSLSIVWKMLVFFPLGLYRRYWRYASVDELWVVILANLLSGTIGGALFFGILIPFGILSPGFPRSIPILDGLLTLLVVGGFRFVLRLGYNYKDTMPDKETIPKKKKRTLIVGAGVAGSMILRELKMNPHLPIDPVGFLDDDHRKRNARINGVPVIGNLGDLPVAVKKNEVQEVIIAMPTASGKTIRHIVQMCKDAKVPSKTIPGMFEILGGMATVSQFRNVEIEDLLRRGIVNTDTEGVGELLRGVV